MTKKKKRPNWRNAAADAFSRYMATDTYMDMSPKSARDPFMAGFRAAIRAMRRHQKAGR